MYVAVKGGEKAIDAAHRLLGEQRRGERLNFLFQTQRECRIIELW